MNTISHRFSWVIIGAGVLFSLFLLRQVPEGVYFSGDGGLKALLAQQLGSGIWQIDLVSPATEWVHQLWNAGLYPYEEPFVYHFGEQYFITFPFTFPLVTAPFYSLFGYRGLYLVPLISTWLIWLIFVRLCQRLSLSTLEEFLALSLLIFTSTLTLYSGMYWEHTLAVFLCFWGMVMFLIPQKLSSRNQEIINAILSGILIGLSVWVRSEFLAMIATLILIVGGITIISYFRKHSEVYVVSQLEEFLYLSKGGWQFIISMLLTIAVFFICNKIIYGHFLGIHALQIVEDFSLIRRLIDAWKSFLEIIVTFFEYFPVACFSLLYLLSFLLTKSFQNKLVKFISVAIILFLLIASVYWINTQGTNGIKDFLKTWWFLVFLSLIWLLSSQKIDLKMNSKTVLFYAISLLFTIGVALLVVPSAEQIAVGGKQWGQRYLLILIPFFSMTTVQQVSFLNQLNKPFIKYFGLFLFSIFIILGIYKNIYEGTHFFIRTHQGVKESIEQIRKSPHQAVVVSHQYAAQMLEPSLDKEKLFFRVDKPENIIALSQKLVENDKSGFIYVCYPYRKCEIPKTIQKNGLFSYNDKEFYLQIKELEKMGKYPIYDVNIIQ